jgi:hypothetical protein
MPMSETALKDVDRKLDEIKEFLQDVFITSEEYSLIKETDGLIRKKSAMSLLI